MLWLPIKFVNLLRSGHPCYQMYKINIGIYNKRIHKKNINIVQKVKNPNTGCCFPPFGYISAENVHMNL